MTTAIFINRLTAFSVAKDIASAHGVPPHVSAEAIRTFERTRRGQMLGYAAVYPDGQGQNHVVTDEDMEDLRA